MSDLIYIEPKLISIPTVYHKYLDTTYDFKIINCHSSTGIEIDKKGKFIRPSVFYNGKSYATNSNKIITIPQSIYFNIKVNNKFFHVFVDKGENPDLFEAITGFRESKSSNKRVHKYMSLFKAYESLTDKNHRQLEFSAVRHSLSHAKKSLTRPNVLQKLDELFGQSSIDFSKPKHARTFYIVYWKLLIATDEILYNLISNKIKTIRTLTGNCAYVK